MTPRPERHGAARRARAGRGARRGGRRWALVPAAVGLLVVVALGYRSWRARNPAPGQDGRAAPGDSAGAMSLREAYAAAARRVGRGDWLASLAYYRRIGVLLARARAGDPWEYHLEYAVALQGASLSPRARSAVERTGMMFEALAELDRAESAARLPHDRALVIATRGKQLRVWGLPWETLLAFRRAQASDPSWAECAESADLYTGVLHHPTRPDGPAAGP